ncbi:hypothetical protein C2S52_008389 [Perilla frutescens var. hirtella]|nr:hypothetical protein C2S52_008389 [Perilla frutescens var. hirtella]
MMRDSTPKLEEDVERIWKMNRSNEVAFETKKNSSLKLVTRDQKVAFLTRVVELSERDSKGFALPGANGFPPPSIVVAPESREVHVPQCHSDIKPFQGQTFKSLDKGIKFYRSYAASCGFDVRLGTGRKWKDGTRLSRYVYCNREGEKNAQDDDVLNGGKQKRRRVSLRFGCNARVCFKLVPHGAYVINIFIEQHTHSLVSDSFKKYLKANRRLDFVHQHFILNCARANIGPMKSYKFFKETVGQFSNIGCTSGEFMNFSRDLKAYVVGVDAQMLLDKLFMKRETCSTFYFDYAVDKNDHLTRLFWVDPIARKNYSVFGDVVSFDATYDTNRYKMIFAPFIGMDNHGKLITFGASLLCSEDKDAYGWVLSKFKDCMGQAPRLIITDQDPALKIVVERSLAPDFAQKLGDIMTEFGLEDDSWLNSMYDIHQFWIPAYFRDFFLGGLCRTTSISESVNNFYSGYLNKNSSLLAFFMQFESALDSQRYSNERLNSADESRSPQLSTPLSFEKHAATVYTTEIFLKVQKEIEDACYVCIVDKIHNHESTREYWVDDCKNGSFRVVLNKVDNSITCSCKKFVMVGLLCCHVFVILKDLKLATIPDTYVISRWTKSARFHQIYDTTALFEQQLEVIDENKLIMN